MVSDAVKRVIKQGKVSVQKLLSASCVPQNLLTPINPTDVTKTIKAGCENVKPAETS